MRRAVVLALVILGMLLGHAPGRARERVGSIEGVVTHRGAAVSGAIVTAAGSEARADGKGRFRIPAIPVSGPYALTEVRVRASGYGAWTLLDARVLPGDALRLSVELREGAVTRRQPAPRTRPRSAERPAPYAAASVTASSTALPGTIRVWVTGDWRCDAAAKGTLVTVDFKEYVKHVLPHEWFASWPEESLRAGAMAARGYAWYQISRGGKWPALGADVMDSTCDQVYDPTLSYASTDAAVEVTWNQKVTRDGRIFICQYWAGTRDDGVRPAADSPYAGRLSQWGSEYWARQGRGWDWILHHYYDDIVISPAIETGLRVTAGPSPSTDAPVWGEPFTASFTARNDGGAPVQLQELYIRMRGPNGEDVDLGGDANAAPIAPGESRTIRRRVPALAAAAPGVYGAYTLTATYRDPNGVVIPGLAPTDASAASMRTVSVAAPRYASESVPSAASLVSYYEATNGTVTLRLRNSGNATWRRTASAAHGAVRLATADPLNRSSRFSVAGSWLTPSRVALVESAVPPGGTGTFRFPVSGAVAPGAYAEAFRLVVEGGSAGSPSGAFGVTATVSLRVLDDAAAPAATLVSPALSTESSTALSFPVRWSASDAGSGVAGYEVQWWDAGAWRPWLRTSATGATFGAAGEPAAVRPGRTYYLRLRATDRAGNVGRWTARRATAAPFDDAQLTVAGAWGRAAASSLPHYRRTLTYAAAAGPRATLRAHGRTAVWIGTKGPDKGLAAVLVDGVRVGTVDLYAPTYSLRTPVWRRQFSANSASHAIEIRPLGRRNAQATGTRVDIDGIAVMR